MNEEPSATPRLFDIDPFRGFVCLCLVGLHFTSTILYEPFRELGGSTFEFLLWNVRLGVESFFVLAGFMVAHNLRPIPNEQVHYSRYFLRRCVRLWLPYAVAVLLAAANLWGANIALGAKQSGPDLFALLAQLTLTQELFDVEEAAIGFWSLVSLEQFYVGWLLLLFLTQRLTSANVVRGLIALSLGLVSLVCLVRHTPELQHQTKFALPFWLCYLILGVLLYEMVHERRQRIAFVVLFIAFVVAGFMATSDTRPFKALFSASILGLLARGWRFPDWPIVRGFRWLGLRSYSVYLTHGIVGYRVFSLYPKVAHHGYLAVFGLLVVALVGSFIATVLFYRFVETPCLQLARRVRYRLSSNA